MLVASTCAKILTLSALLLFLLAVFIQVWGEMWHKQHLHLRLRLATVKAYGTDDGIKLSSNEKKKRIRKLEKRMIRTRKRTRWWSCFCADVATVLAFGLATLLVLVALATADKPEGKSACCQTNAQAACCRTKPQSAGGCTCRLAMVGSCAWASRTNERNSL